jgi:hypothetical protein
MTNEHYLKVTNIACSEREMEAPTHTHTQRWLQMSRLSLRNYRFKFKT